MSTVAENVSLNTEQQLYVIPSGGCYSCLGFDVCLRRANAVAAWLRDNGEQAADVPSELRGTLEAYGLYSDLMTQGATFNHRTGKRCGADLTPELIGKEGRRVAVVDCDGVSRRFIVGKSGGWFSVHLEVKTSRSLGGCAVYGAPFRSLRVVR